MTNVMESIDPRGADDPSALEISWSRAPDVIDAEIDSEIVLMSVDSGKYLFLNTTATVIWRALGTPSTLAGLRDSLGACYDVDASVCAREIQILLERLESKNMVQRHSTGH